MYCGYNYFSRKRWGCGVKNKRKKLPTKISSRRIAQDSEKRSPAATVIKVNMLFITFPFESLTAR
jgi:hypothetical protein